MSAYPLMLRGSALRALVVGGGRVAERKTRALLDSGAHVRVVAPHIQDTLRTLAGHCERLTLHEREYAPGDVAESLLVIAATDRREVNAQVAADALHTSRLVNVADAPDEGNCMTPAIHRAGDRVVAVTAGSVPAAAARVRDALASRLDGRYARAVALLAALRARLLGDGGREAWRRAAGELAGEDFCVRVENGTLERQVAEWR